MSCQKCEWGTCDECQKNNWFFDYDEDTVFQIASPSCYVTYPSEVEAIKGGIKGYLDMAERVREKFADKLKEEN